MSVADTAPYVTTAEHIPGVLFAVTFAGHVIAGACVSLTVTLKLHVPVFDAASVAVHVTSVVPIGNVDPDVGMHAIEAPGQLSDADAEKLTTAEH